MSIYIRKKNVKIFKLYQNCRNDVQFNSSLEKIKSKKKVIFFLFVFRFTNKQIQKNEKRKSTSVFRFSFYLQKKYKKPKNENLPPFSVLFAKKTKKNKKQKSTSIRFSSYLHSKLILVFHCW